MSATTSLILANAAVLFGVAGYIGFLVSNSVGIRKREQQIELLEGNHDG